MTKGNLKHAKGMAGNPNAQHLSFLPGLSENFDRGLEERP